MARPSIRKTKRKKVDDETFLRRLIELGENKSALARELGLTPSAVVMRLRRIDPDGKRLETAKTNGRAAVIVHQAVNNVGFEAGANSAARNLKHIENLTKYCDVIDGTVDQLVTEMAEQLRKPGAKLKPYHVDMLCKLTTQGRGLAETIHRIWNDLFSLKEGIAYIETVTRILEKYEPDVRKKIFCELVALGHEEQAVALHGDAGTNP